MTTINVVLDHVCSGGEHARINITGATTQIFDVSVSAFSDSINEEEALAFLKVVCKMAKAGRNINQTRTLLANGVTITV